MYVTYTHTIILAYYARPRTSSNKVRRKDIRDVSTFTAQHVRAALSVLHMAQKLYHVKSIICYLCFM